MPCIEIFCDGSCHGEKGGWGAVMRFGTKKKEFYGFLAETTSQRAELHAALEAIKKIKDRSYEIHIYTDSQYLQKGITEWIKRWRVNGWKTANRKTIKNQDLWKAISIVNDAFSIHWHWVRGHAGHPEQERADELANIAVRTGRSL